MNIDNFIETCESLLISNESYLISREDDYINFEDFESGKNNVLLITGLSGSGKSTLAENLAEKYKGEWIELDIFEHCTAYSEDNLKEAGKLFSNYLLKLRKDIYDYGFRDNKDDEKESFDKYVEEFNLFLDYIFKYCKSKPNKKFIIEGIQIATIMDPNKIKGLPLIIVNSSITRSLKRRRLRNGESLLIYLKMVRFKENKRLIKWYFDNDRELIKFKEKMLE